MVENYGEATSSLPSGNMQASHLGGYWESDVGYVKWLLVQFIQRGEVYPLLKWEKQTLLDYTKDFAPVMCHVHSEMKVSIFILLCDL